ncbi:hypothetical protein HZA99_03055 [Candidatus Woesearchaeota archaeon]|nr:hypothetical protein [Candidatus Woesearchaeota archaeon]
MNIKIFFGLLAIVTSLSGYAFYMRSLYRGEIKPHAFSWFIWGVLTLIGFSVQFIEHAGPSAWAYGVSGLLCLFIFFIALKKGEKNIVFVDWLSLLAAGISLLLWYLTNNPLATVLIITGIDFCGFFPTIRKSYFKPHEENLTVYFMCGLAYLFTLFAIENYIFVTYFYPAALVVFNWLFVLMLFVRRKQLQK